MSARSESKEFVYYPDDYVVGKKLGAGAFGETSIVRNTRSGFPFVIKRLPKVRRVEKIVKERAPDGTIVERKIVETKPATTKKMFDKEADILRRAKRICEPNILCYVAVGARNEDANSPDRILVTEFLDGYITLEDYIKQTPEKERWANIRPLLVNLVQGLNDLHRIGIAHRDIKPTNLMVNPAGPEPAARKGNYDDDYDDYDDYDSYDISTDIADFAEPTPSAYPADPNEAGMHIKYIDVGLSCTEPECSDEKSIVGSPAYLAPEVSFALDEPLVPLNLETWKRADIWALAITMIEYIIGEEKMDEYLEQNELSKNLIYRLPPEFVKQYPDVAEVIFRMLTSDPRSRRLPNLRFV